MELAVYHLPCRHPVLFEYKSQRAKLSQRLWIVIRSRVIEVVLNSASEDDFIIITSPYTSYYTNTNPHHPPSLTHSLINTSLRLFPSLLQISFHPFHHRLQLILHRLPLLLRRSLLRFLRVRGEFTYLADTGLNGATSTFLLVHSI